MRGNTATARQLPTERFVPVDLRYFVADRPSIVDLYLRLDGEDSRLIPSRLDQAELVAALDGHSYVRYSASDVPLDRDLRSQLLGNGITRLYYLRRDGATCAGGRSLDDVLALSDTEVSCVVKTSLVYEDVLHTTLQALTSPSSSGSVLQTSHTIQTLVRHLIYSPQSVQILVGLVRHESSIFTHCANVCVYSTCLARVMAMPAEALVDLGTAALLHDVGMLKVPAAITGKPGPLTVEERAVVQKHPQWGHDMLAKAYRKQPVVLSVVLQHHERADGNGYPAKLTGDQMTQFARMVGVVDKYEALTSDRPHRPAMNPYKATQAVRGELVGQFEQELFVPMLRMVSPRR